MDIQIFITKWIAAGNAYDTEKYLSFYLPNAVMDDPSVGSKFEGHKGIQQYFDSYFIGNNTHTEQVKLKIIDQRNAYLEVLFTGDFPEGKIGGTFELRFENDKIAFVKADLIQ